MQEITMKEVHELRHSARRVVRELGLLTDAYFDIGVTVAERHLLIELSLADYPDVKDLSEKLLLDKSTTSRLISKAVKKGYVIYIIDQNDKRRRCLQITDKGLKTLKAFETLAQKQVLNALLTLSHAEIKTVHKGMALFAEGLTRSRLNSESEKKKELKQRFSRDVKRNSRSKK